MGLFDDKVAIITGAARGLGRDFAHFFANDGAAVVLADLNLDGVQEGAKAIAASGRALGISLDVTNLTSAEQMVEQTLSAFGRIDILINNAGIWGDLQRSPLLSTTPDYWDLVMNVNVKGALLCSRAAAPFMRKQRWGRIINISSSGAYKAGGVYSVSKLALNQLTYSLAAELADAGITCNALAPGPIYTEATQRHYSPAEFEQLVYQGMVKRAGTSQDLYGALRYLSSEDASWVTGQILPVNGGALSRF